MGRDLATSSSSETCVYTLVKLAIKSRDTVGRGDVQPASRVTQRGSGTWPRAQWVSFWGQAVTPISTL